MKRFEYCYEKSSTDRCVDAQNSLADADGPLREIMGDDIVTQAKPVWGLNKEGEIQGCFTDSGVHNMWNIMGNLALCRFYSKRIALRKTSILDA